MRLFPAEARNQWVATFHVSNGGGHHVSLFLPAAVAACVSGVEGEAAGGAVPDKRAFFFFGVVAVVGIRRW